MTDKDKGLRSAKPDVKSYVDGFEISDRLPWDFSEAKKDFYRAYIFAALTITNGNVCEAARIMDVERTNVYRMLKKIGYYVGDFRPKKGQ